jgi:acid phosphatase
MLRRLSIALALSCAVPAAFFSAGAGTSSAAPSSDHARAAAAMCGTTTKAPTYKHVVIIMEENYSYSSIVGSSQAPYINSVIKSCGLATDYHNITHNSLPNYIGLTDGMSVSQLKPYDNDCTPGSGCEVSASTNNLFNELASKGGWKGYDESMPSPCDKSDAGNYAPKHNPAVYYLDIKTCSTDDVPLGTTSSSALLKDFGNPTTAPALAFVTPNLIDDMHQGSIPAGDKWLKTWLPLITATKTYQAGNTLIFIVWDEGEPATTGYNCVNSSQAQCHVAAIVVAPSVKAGAKVSTDFSHYSMLKTIEDIFGVPELGGAKTAKSMASGFNL